MLEARRVEEEEERLREAVNALPPTARKMFYEAIRHRIKDPDTYAAMNWFFITGLHHFYLGRWGWGLLDLGAFVLGVALLFTPLFIVGIVIIVAVSVMELWALFRAQLIVQDHNNRVYRDVLARLSSSSPPGGGR